MNMTTIPRTMTEALHIINEQNGIIKTIELKLAAVTEKRDYIQELYTEIIKDYNKATEQRDRLAGASKSLLHYIKLVRGGDSPLIHAELIESLDLAASRLDEALQSLNQPNKK